MLLNLYACTLPLLDRSVNACMHKPKASRVQWMHTLHVQGVENQWGQGSRPIVLALSNPSEVAECTAQQAHDWSGGRAVYASGTAFPPFDTKDGRKVPAQANNSLIFPGNASSS